MRTPPRLVAVAVVSLLLLAATLSPTSGDQKQGEPQPQATNAQNGPTPSAISMRVETATISLPSPTPQKDTSQCQSQNWYDWFWPPVWSNWALVVAAIWAGRIALQTLGTIDGQTKLSREALRLEQRPWIVPTSKVHVGFLNGEISSITSIPFCVDLQNTGTTPALNVTIKIQWAISNWQDPMPGEKGEAQYVPESQVHHIGAIGPGIVHQQWASSGRPLQQEVIDAVFKFGSSRLTIYGRIEYRDGIDPGQVRTTEFCLQKAGPQAGFSVSGPYNSYT